MKIKSLFTALLLTICSSVFGQTYNQIGVTSWGRTANSKGFFYKANISVKPGGIYFYTQQQIDSLFHYGLPTGLQGQILRNTSDNTGTYTAQEPLVYGQFVFTDAQLTRALAAGQATQLQIFNSFFRYSHGGNPTIPANPQQNNTLPGQPLQTNSWAYDTVAKRIYSTFNSGSAMGLVSPNAYDHYTHSVTISADSVDNDMIGLEIAFTEKDTWPNNAYGLNPADFTWPIDVVHTTIHNQHSLTVLRNRNGSVLSYFIVYDFQKLTQKILADGTNLSGLYNTTGTWPGNTADLRVVRSGDTITVTTTNFSDAPGGKGSLRFPLVINLNSDTVLTKFKGKHRYGYAVLSQAGAYWTNVSFSGSDTNIYDLRTGGVYTYNGTSYTFDPSKSISGLLGTRFWWRNTTEQTFGFMPPTGLYDVITQPNDHNPLYGSATLNFPSTGANSQSTLTLSVPGALIGSPVVVGPPTSIVTGNYQFNGYVASTGVVSVTYQNLSGGTVDPTIGLFHVTVFQ